MRVYNGGGGSSSTPMNQGRVGVTEITSTTDIHSPEYYRGDRSIAGKITRLGLTIAVCVLAAGVVLYPIVVFFVPIK